MDDTKPKTWRATHARTLPFAQGLRDPDVGHRGFNFTSVCFYVIGLAGGGFHGA